MHATFTPAIDAKLQQWAADGVSCKDQARMLNVPVRRVHGWRRRLGISPEMRGAVPTPELLAKIETWVADGWPLKEIAETSGLSLPKVRRYFPGAGLQDPKDQGALGAAKTFATIHNPKAVRGL